MLPSILSFEEATYSTIFQSLSSFYALVLSYSCLIHLAHISFHLKCCLFAFGSHNVLILTGGEGPSTSAVESLATGRRINSLGSFKLSTRKLNETWKKSMNKRKERKRRQKDTYSAESPSETKDKHKKKDKEKGILGRHSRSASDAKVLSVDKIFEGACLYCLKINICLGNSCCSSLTIIFNLDYQTKLRSSGSVNDMHLARNSLPTSSKSLSGTSPSSLRLL